MSKQWTRIGLAMLALGYLAGCHILVSDPGDSGGRSWWYYCDEFGCYRCDAAGCIFPDYLCASGDCGDCRDGSCGSEPLSCEVMADCSRGQRCLDNVCSSRQTEPCHEHSECGSGAYCSDGVCQVGGLCEAPSDCVGLGEGFACDGRGCCVPGTRGPSSCENASDCGAGGICVDGLCGTCEGDCGGGKTCELDRHCGEGRACLDGQCVNRCVDDDAACASSQVCNPVLGICLAREPEGCAAQDACGAGKVCVDGSCHLDCTSDGSCDNSADRCSDVLTVGERDARACVTDHSAQPECALSRECSDNEQCVNGVCRTTCIDQADCAHCDDGPVCGKGGFCMTEYEASPECTTNEECGGGRLCLDAHCKTIL